MKNSFVFYLQTYNHLKKIEYKLSFYDDIPYGGSNPYYFCSGCDKSMVQISIDLRKRKKNTIQGHSQNCRRAKLEQMKTKLERQLNKDFLNFIQNKEYNTKNFLSFQFLVRKSSNKNKYHDGLLNLLTETKKELEKGKIQDSEMFFFYEANKND